MDIITATIPETTAAMAAGSGTHVTVLSVGPTETDWSRLRRIFQHTNWDLYRSKDYAEATELLQKIPVGVVITEEKLPEGYTWVDLLDYTSKHSRARVIVISTSTDDSLWEEVLNLGGYDVMMKPLDKVEVIRVISLAWLNWRDERRAAPAVTASTIH